ncbi:MAG: DUF3604 domain-containing protein [candidate division WS1 bacterium]|nr:DUF3604 domain-containing protein [candidate division WS1 bacterium]
MTQKQSSQRSLLSIEPPEAMASVPGTWTITISGVSVAEGGIVRIVFGGTRGNPSDWTRPQTSDPEAREYVSGRRSGGGSLTVTVPPGEEFRGPAIDLTVLDAPLAEDETLTVILGDTSAGGTGSTPQSFSQPNKVVEVLVAEPSGGDGKFSKIGEATMNVTGGPMDTIRVLAPATVPAGKQFSIALKAEDVQGNVASMYIGELSLEISDTELVTGPESVKFVGPGGVMIVDGFKAFSRGLVRIIAVDSISDIKYVSNPILITKHDQAQLYFGVIHGHTERSDGVGTVEDYYACMRDDNRLDFGAVGDHDHEHETTDADWEVIQRVTAESNDPGRFVTLLGYEWAKWRRNGDGDRNVYFDRDGLPMLRSSDQQYPRPSDLFAGLRECDCRSIVIPHHPASNGNFCDYSQHDPAVERLVEIYSSWGNSECSIHDGNPYPMRPAGLPQGGFVDVPMDSGEVPEGFVQRALEMGRRLGFVGGGDDHLGHPGDPVKTGAEPFRYADGLMGVWAPELTREAIFQAMYERHTYATTGARMIVLFRVADAFMGDEVQVAQRPELAKARTIDAFIAAEAKLAQVEIIRNNEVVHSLRPEDSDLTLEWTDEDPLEPLALTPIDGGPRFVFYYLRVLQADGQMAWASPVWLLLGDH